MGGEGFRPPNPPPWLRQITALNCASIQIDSRGHGNEVEMHVCYSVELCVVLPTILAFETVILAQFIALTCI